MKSVFEESYRNELISRINLLTDASPRQWGKMSVYQMIRHCSLWDEWVLGKNKPTYKQAFIGKLFGRMALKKLTKNDNPIDRGVPTSGWLKLKETNGDIESEKSQWIALLKDYANYSNPEFIHDFFGKMTTEEIGILAYKHTDHHLRQFNA